MILDVFNFELIIFFTLSTIVYFYIYLNRIKIGNKLKTNDIPDHKRKIHKEITPRTGAYSLAIILLLILIYNLIEGFLDKDFNLIIVVSLFAFIIGLVDDAKELNALKKIILLTIISFIAIFLSENLTITKIYLKTFDTFFYFNQFSIFFTLLCILLLTNAMNLVDGINGIAISLFFIFFLYTSKIYQIKDVTFISFFIIFNLIIIFYHNYHGKHFLGDAGTLMLSTLLSLIIIKSNNHIIENPSYKYSAEHIFIIFIIPGLDMLRLFVKRSLLKKNPFSADKNHLHHYLINRFGLKSSLILYILIVNIPILLSYFNIFEQSHIILFTIATFFVAIKYLKTTSNN